MSGLIKINQNFRIFTLFLNAPIDEKMRKQKCPICRKTIPWLDMLTPRLENYFEKFNKIICPHCGNKIVFNKNSRFISMGFMCTVVGLLLASSGLPGYYVLLIGFFFVIFLGRPIERILNIFFTLFFSLEKASEAHKNNHNEKA